MILGDTLSLGNVADTVATLNELSGEQAAKTVLQVLVDKYNGWTAEKLLSYLNGEGCPIFGNPICENRIRELAYTLWEQSGKPSGQDKQFWDDAVNRLAPKTWFVRSGELTVSGHGELQEVLSLALTHAADEGWSLGPDILISSVSFDQADGEPEYGLDTVTELDRLEIWNSN